MEFARGPGGGGGFGVDGGSGGLEDIAIAVELGDDDVAALEVFANLKYTAFLPTLLSSDEDFAGVKVRIEPGVLNTSLAL